MFGLIELGEYQKWQKRRQNPTLTPDFLGNLRVLVVGGGSVGQRYLSLLLGLGVQNVAVVEPKEDRRADIKNHYGPVVTFASEEEAYKAGRYGVVIVANPPVFHIESGKRAVAQGAHVLMEKSISHNAANVEEFLEAAKNAGRIVGVCYMYRFYDTLQYIKKLLSEGVLGKIHSAQITFSEYLPDWHPWEKPSEWYAGQKSLGGSELLDENHTVDFSRWFFGDISEVMGLVGRIAEVSVDSDDFAEFTCIHKSGTITHIHQDAFGRKPRKDMWIMGEKGTLYWDSYMGGNKVEWYNAETKKTEIYNGKVNRSDAFFELLRDFLEAVAKGTQPTITGKDAFETLRVCLAAVESAHSGTYKKLNSLS